MVRLGRPAAAPALAWPGRCWLRPREALVDRVGTTRPCPQPLEERPRLAKALWELTRRRVHPAPCQRAAGCPASPGAVVPELLRRLAHAMGVLQKARQKNA